MMFEHLSINEKRVFPTFVVSTVSSGKSTLINALMAKKLMPSRNTATTARALAILDNDKADGFVAHTVGVDGKHARLKDVDLKTVTEYNEESSISEMIIEGQIKGIKNSKRSLLIVDTPGVNNCMDKSHGDTTKKIIDTASEGLILYVFNVQQLGTNDDASFLSWVSEKLRERPGLSIIFAVNKMDCLDTEKEPFEEVLEYVKNYVKGFGIEDAPIIPVSAYYAYLFKKLLKGETLSEFEEERFPCGYFCFGGDARLPLGSYAAAAGKDMTCVCGGREYTAQSLYTALYNTGFPALENAIESVLISSAKATSPKISFRSNKKGDKRK